MIETHRFTARRRRLGFRAAWLLSTLAPAHGLAQAPEPAPAEPAAPPAEAAPPPAPAAPPEGEAAEAVPAPAAAEPEPAETAPAAAEPEPEATSDVVVESGGGLFEESQAAPVVADEPGAPATAPVRGFDFTGYVRGDFFVGKTPDSDRALLQAGYGELALRLTTKRQTYGDAVAEARLRYGLEGETYDLIVDLREAYVNAYVGALDVRLGKQIVVWGRADAFNPTNNITPVDLTVRSPIEDDRRVGNVGARAFLNFQPMRLEGVWMPLYVPIRFPPIELAEGITLSDDFPPPELQNGLGAGRLHLELPAFEASVSYLYGLGLLPGLSLLGFGVDQNAGVDVGRTPYHHHVVGFDFSTAVGDVFAIRGEAAYKKPTRERVYTPNPELQYVLGVDRAFGNVSVIAQYVGKYVFDWEQRDHSDDLPDVEFLAGLTETDIQDPMVVEDIVNPISQELRATNQELFQQTKEIQHVVSLRLEWLALHETLSLSALGMYNISTEEWLAYPKLTYKMSDALSTSVGGELYFGPEDTLLDFLDEKLTAGYAELRYAF